MRNQLHAIGGDTDAHAPIRSVAPLRTTGMEILRLFSVGGSPDPAPPADRVTPAPVTSRAWADYVEWSGLDEGELHSRELKAS